MKPPTKLPLALALRLARPACAGVVGRVGVVLGVGLLAACAPPAEEGSPYPIYETVLEALADSLPNRPLLVRRHTGIHSIDPSYSYLPNAFEQALGFPWEGLHTIIPGLPPELVQLGADLNAEPLQLHDEIPTSDEVQMLDDALEAGFYEERHAQMWAELQNRYSSPLLVRLSVPAISESGRDALLYLTTVCAPSGCSSGAFVHLRRSARGWRIERMQPWMAN